MSETLIERIARLQGELNTFEGRENLTQDETDRKNWLSNQLAEAEQDLKSYQQREQAIEEKVEAEDVPFSVAGAPLGDLPAPVIKLVDSIVKADRKRIYNEVAVDIEQIENERDQIKAEFATYKAETDIRLSNQDKALEAVRTDYEECAQELHEKKAETIQMTAERDEARRNRDNAAQQLVEAQQEIARLNEQVEEYQRAKVWGERQQQQIIDVTPEDEIQAAAEAVKKYYKDLEDWGSVIKVNKPDGSFETVKRAELEANWAPLDPPLVEPVLPFQGQDASTESSDYPVLPPQTTAEVGNQFPETGHDMAVPTSGVEETVSREEFETLKNDVEALKRKVGWAA